MKLTKKIENLEIQSLNYFYKAKKFVEQLPNFYKGNCEEWCNFINSIDMKYYYVGYRFISKNEMAVELFIDNKEDNGYTVVATKYIKWINTVKQIIK